LTGARFDAARADLCGFIGSQDRFARAIEGLTKIQQDINKGRVVGAVRAAARRLLILRGHTFPL
jgi:hypothetical protein